MMPADSDDDEFDRAELVAADIKSNQGCKECEEQSGYDLSRISAEATHDAMLAIGSLGGSGEIVVPSDLVEVVGALSPGDLHPPANKINTDVDENQLACRAEEADQILKKEQQIQKDRRQNSYAALNNALPLFFCWSIVGFDCPSSWSILSLRAV